MVSDRDDLAIGRVGCPDDPAGAQLISRSSGMVSDRDDDDLCRLCANDDVLRETVQSQTSRSLLTSFPRHSGERNDLFFQQIQRGENCLGELATQTGSGILIPRGGLRRLDHRLVEDPDTCHYEALSRFSSLLRNSSRSTSLAVPVSMARRRFRISIFHAESASGSAGSSRLLTSSYASCARSSSERASTSERSLSRVAVSIIPPALLL